MKKEQKHLVHKLGQSGRKEEKRQTNRTEKAKP
jgi:hypothetical protein